MPTIISIKIVPFQQISESLATVQMTVEREEWRWVMSIQAYSTLYPSKTKKSPSLTSSTCAVNIIKNFRLT